MRANRQKVMGSSVFGGGEEAPAKPKAPQPAAAAAPPPPPPPASATPSRTASRTSSASSLSAQSPPQQQPRPRDQKLADPLSGAHRKTISGTTPGGGRSSIVFGDSEHPAPPEDELRVSRRGHAGIPPSAESGALPGPQVSAAAASATLPRNFVVANIQGDDGAPIGSQSPRRSGRKFVPPPEEHHQPARHEGRRHAGPDDDAAGSVEADADLAARAAAMSLRQFPSAGDESPRHSAASSTPIHRTLSYSSRNIFANLSPRRGSDVTALSDVSFSSDSNSVADSVSERAAPAPSERPPVPAGAAVSGSASSGSAPAPGAPAPAKPKPGMPSGSTRSHEAHNRAMSSSIHFG